MLSKIEVERRKVLKSIGTSAGVGTLVGTAAANSEDRERLFSGISYDALTHKLAGTTAASLEASSDGGVEGYVRVGGFRIDFSDVNIQEINRDEGEVVYGTSLEGARYIKDGEPLQFQMIEYSTGVYGSITRPSPEFGSLGFTMADNDHNRSRFDLAEGLWNKGDGIVPDGYDEIPAVPDTGVPRNTGIASRRPTKGTDGGES